jgi:ATPase family associated with various cellular activities (AAA)
MKVRIENSDLALWRDSIIREDTLQDGEDYYSVRRKIDNIIGNNLTKGSYIMLTEFSEKILERLELLDKPYINIELRKYRLLCNNNEAIVNKITDFVTAFKAFANNLKKPWLYNSDEDGNMTAWLITSVEYHKRAQHQREYCSVTLRANSLLENTVTRTLNYYAYDMGVNVASLLSNYKYFSDDEDEEFYSMYTQTKQSFLLAVKNKVGSQFNAIGKSRTITSRSWYSSDYYLTNIDGTNPVVLDDYKIHNDRVNFSTEYGCVGRPEPFEVPYLFVVPIFDLKRHIYLSINFNNLSDYIYDKEVLNKVIIEKKHKEIISKLINITKDSSDDIIRGKTGGSFIMITGIPGVGKTLCAEAYSEILSVPLYRVQCAQLGITVDTVETNLKEVLQRAQRWKCVLLIDEADVYVRSRGDDLVQNAIVGTFLRVLEYYQGILFMTSNLGDNIDDAILSRTSAWINFDKPSSDQVLEIFKVLAKQMSIVYDTKQLAQTVSGIKLTGRDIKSLLKLSKAIGIVPANTSTVIKLALQYTYNSTRQ